MTVFMSGFPNQCPVSVAGTRVLIIVEGLLMSERCHRAGRSKRGGWRGVLLVAYLHLPYSATLHSKVVPGGSAETTRAETFTQYTSLPHSTLPCSPIDSI